MSSDDEPRFPPEMEREIFLTTALLYPSTIPPLLRLTAASSKPPAFLAQAVRCVVFHDHNSRKNNDAAHSTLRLCTGVTSLAVPWTIHAPELLPILSAMPVQRLTGLMTTIIDGEIAAHSIFCALTHLEIFEGLETPSGLIIVGILPSLPCLTHLALNLIGRLDDIGERMEIIPKNCHHLRHLNVVVVVVYYPVAIEEILAARRAAIGEIPECLRDPRFVVRSAKHRWYEGVLDQPNFWTVAEDFVARKQRGEVDDFGYGGYGKHIILEFFIHTKSGGADDRVVRVISWTEEVLAGI
ncbi:hypothetical protein C8F01DRAFT_1087822 [Mycena amicta]|nr:hypothetical protein C8F01DRAFT_1087822 [Mycena amicta]